MNGIEKMLVLGHSKAGVPLIMDMAYEILKCRRFEVLKNVDLEDVPVFEDLFEVTQVFHEDFPYSKENGIPVQFGVQQSKLRKIVFDFFCLNYRIDRDRYLSLIHPFSYCASSAQVGKGCLIEPGAVVSSMTELGFGVSVKRSASVGHHAQLGDYVSVNPGAVLAGFVTIGEGTEIGVGAVVSNNISIGAGSLIGAGSVVVENIPDGVIAFGNPCKVIRENTPKK